MVTVRVVELAGNVECTVYVTQPDGSVKEFHMPKFFLDIIKASIPTYNMTNMINRTSDNTYNLS